LIGQIESGIDRLRWTRRFTRATIDAFMGVDVELVVLPCVTMNARDRADTDARLILDVIYGC
jgi:hypothetical protein